VEELKSKPSSGRRKKSATMSANRLIIGWHAAGEKKVRGRTVRFDFYDKSGNYLGELAISSANVSWRKKKKQYYIDVPTTDLNDLFSSYYD
jgi:hypothetical protein